jgi:hypothetical protein
VLYWSTRDHRPHPAVHLPVSGASACFFSPSFLTNQEKGRKKDHPAAIAWLAEFLGCLDTHINQLLVHKKRVHRFHLIIDLDLLVFSS